MLWLVQIEGFGLLLIKVCCWVGFSLAAECMGSSINVQQWVICYYSTLVVAAILDQVLKVFVMVCVAKAVMG